jgi:hypothetical protein
VRVQYNREDDVLLIYLSKGRIDHAEEVDALIVHFSPENHPVLLEVLDASDLIARLAKITVTAAPDQSLPV